MQLPYFIVTGREDALIDPVRRAAIAKYGPDSWARQIYQVPWGSRDWPERGYADGHEARRIRDEGLVEKLAARHASNAPLSMPTFGVSLDAEFTGFMQFDDPRCLDADLIRAFRVRIAEIKAASGGRAEVYSWNVGAPDNKDGVDATYISKVAHFLLECGFDGWISAMVPQTQDEERLSRRARRIVEAHDAVLLTVQSFRPGFKGFISIQPIVRQDWEPLTSTAKSAILKEIGDRPWLMWCQTDDDSVNHIYAQGVAV